MLRDREILHAKRTEYGKQVRKAYEAHEFNAKRSDVQRLEPRKDGLANTVTTSLKDSMYVAKVGNMDDKTDFMNPPESDDSEKTIEDYLYKGFGIFKITPREALRLMGVKDADIDKMKAVNSNTQLLKEAGNSICVPCLEAIFSQLNIQGVTPWNEKYKEN